MPNAEPIRLKIDNIYVDIVGQLDSSFKESLQNKLSFRPEGYQFNPNFHRWICNSNGKPVRRFWDGWKRQFWCGKKRTYFPTGLISLAIDHFKEKNVPYIIENYRIAPEQNYDLGWSDKYSLYDYQIPAVDIACNKTRGIINAATGSGKTLIGAAIIRKLQVKPFIWFVTSRDLLDQAKEELESALTFNGQPVQIGQIGGGVIDIRDISVCTIQTAIRALGERWDKETKFDSDDQDDLTPIEQHKDAICDYIRSAKGAISDEIQNWRAQTAQLVNKELKSAYYNFGLSATSQRDQGDDMLIQACFGKIIARITASELIERGLLVRPNIKIIHIQDRKSKFRQWQAIYKDRIVDCEKYNGLVANIANSYIEAGRLVLVLSQQVAHGENLASMITGAQYLSGKSSRDKRKDGLNNLRNGYIKCISSSSLPHEEILLVKHNGIVKNMEIGDICNRYKKEVLSGDFEVLCSIDGISGHWSKITDTHIHERTNDIVKVITDRYEDVLVTENHSLVASNLKQILPSVGNPACSPLGVPRAEKLIEEINLVKLLSSINDSSIEIEVRGLNLKKIKLIKSEYLHYKLPNFLSRQTKITTERRLRDKPKSYKNAIFQLIDKFHYEKKKYRAKLSDVKDCDELFKNFECRIFIRRSRKKFDLPTSLKITKELAIISGIMCGDGHIKHHTKGKTCKSIYAFDFAGLEDLSTSPEAKHDIDKQNIRKIFTDSVQEVFSTKIFSNWQHLRIRGKLMYYLFQELGHINSRGQKTVPFYVFNSDPEIQESFLWGLYLSDGSKKLDYTKNDSNIFTAINIHNTSRPLISGIGHLLGLLRKRSYLYQDNQRYRKWKIPYTYAIVDPILHLQPTRHQNRLDFDDPNRTQVYVKKTGRNDKYVYDISVEDCHNFISGCGSILCHNTIFDEGVNLKSLDTVILAGHGKSKTRAMQRIGRITRRYTRPDGTEKTTATAIDFCIHDKFLEDHSKAREAMYRTEPAYNIEHING